MIIQEERQVININGKLNFLFMCKRLGCLPRSLHFRLPGEHDYDKSLRRMVEHRILRKEMEKLRTKLSRLQGTVRLRKQCLFLMVDDLTLKEHVELFVSRSCSSAREACEEHFIKLKRWMQKRSGLYSTEFCDTPAVVSDEIVRNFSSVTLNEDHISVLSKGLNFAITPRFIPKMDMAASVESATRSLPPEDRMYVLRRVTRIMRSCKPPQMNITLSEKEAIESLKSNPDIVILPADKGNVTVVLDRREYTSKLDALIETGPYEEVKRDPSARFRKDMHDILSRVCLDSRMERKDLSQLCPTYFQRPHLFGLPKVHRDGIPLRPIISMRGCLFAPLSRYLADLLKPYACRGDSFILNSHDLVQKLSGTPNLARGELLSLDVDSLFTKVPVAESLEVVKRLLDDDPTLQRRTKLKPEELLQLTELTLTRSYFQHNEKLYVQTEGVSMGSSLGPVIANIYMIHFEESMLTEAMNKGLATPTLWYRYVDDVLLQWIHSEDELQAFYEFANSFRDGIRFKMEREQQRRLPFLDVMVDVSSPAPSFSVYRKPTHSNLYLRRESCHSRSTFRSVASSLATRARRVCSAGTLKRELQHVQQVLRANGYSEEEVKRASREPSGPKASDGVPPKRVSLPYVPNVTERIVSVLRGAGVRASSKPVRTLRSLLVRKRPAPAKQLGVVYRLNCKDCPWKYVGETQRPVEVRKKEHVRAVRNFQLDSSEVAKHVHESQHHVDFDSMEVIDQEEGWFKRVIKEAIWTKRLQSGNRTKCEVGACWDSVFAVRD